MHCALTGLVLGTTDDVAQRDLNIHHTTTAVGLTRDDVHTDYQERDNYRTQIMEILSRNSVKVSMNVNCISAVSDKFTVDVMKHSNQGEAVDKLRFWNLGAVRSNHRLQPV